MLVFSYWRRSGLRAQLKGQTRNLVDKVLSAVSLTRFWTGSGPKFVDPHRCSFHCLDFPDVAAGNRALHEKQVLSLTFVRLTHAQKSLNDTTALSMASFMLPPAWD